MNALKKRELESRRDQLREIPRESRTPKEQEELEDIEQQLLQMPSNLMSSIVAKAIAKSSSDNEKKKGLSSITRGL